MRPEREPRTSLACLAAVLICAACKTPLRPRSVEAGLGVSALPQLGLVGTFDQILHESPQANWFFEGEIARQFIDDGDIVTTPTPRGDEFHAKVGLKVALQPAEQSRWTLRTGFVEIRVTGNPNIFDSPGDGGGVYLGVGYEVDVAPHITMGPDVSVNAIFGEGSLKNEVFPIISWRIYWHP